MNPYTDRHAQLYKGFNKNCRNPDYSTNPFPNKKSCSGLNDEFLLLKAGKSIDEIKALIFEFAEEAAYRNGYKYDEGLSKKNSAKYKFRKVYIAETRNKIISYLCVDVESGGFEVFDKNQIHLGQYDFSGEQSKEAEPKTHKIYT